MSLGRHTSSSNELAVLGQDPELRLGYAKSRYDKFPLFQQLKFDIARLSVT